jgi:hypothetical protein
MRVAPFRIVRLRGPRKPLIAHIPHASTVVPPWVRLENTVLSEADLQRELVRLTDGHTDQLLSWVSELGGSLFINTLSRLVFDSERFLDDAVEHFGMAMLLDCRPTRHLRSQNGSLLHSRRSVSPCGSTAPSRERSSHSGSLARTIVSGALGGRPAAASTTSQARGRSSLVSSSPEFSGGRRSRWSKIHWRSLRLRSSVSPMKRNPVGRAPAVAQASSSHRRSV